MSFNPYAPPAHQPANFPSPGGGVGGPMGWEPGEVAQTSWEIVKRHWPVLVFAPMVGQVIAGIPGQIIQAIGQKAAESNPDPEVIVAIVGVVSALVGMVIGAYFNVGITRIMLSAARGGVPNFGDVFSGGNRFMALLGAKLLVFLVVFVGFILLIVPGIYAALALSQTSYFVVDQNMGPIEAMKASWSATEGQKGSLFLYGLLAVGLTLLGLLCCCVGVVVTSAIVSVGSAMIFTRLTGTVGAPPLSDYMGGSGLGPGWTPPGYTPPPGQGGPPGYGGPPNQQGPGWG